MIITRFNRVAIAARHVLGVLLLGYPCMAAMADDLSMQDALSRTLSSNPQLLAFGYELEAQEGRITQAGLSPRPELTVEVEDVLGTGASRGVSGMQTTVGISWLVEGDLRQRRLDVARTGSMVLAAEAEILRLDTVAETARRFITALTHQTHQDLIVASVERGRTIVEAVSQRVQAGTANPADLARARADLSRRELAHEDVRHEMTSAYARLAAQWGQQIPEFSTLQGELLSLAPLQSFSSLLARLEQSPDISRFLNERRLHESVLALEKSRRDASWRFNAGVRRSERSNDIGIVAGITIPLNMGNNNQGNIAETAARVRQIDAEREAARVALNTELYVLYQELEHAHHRVEMLATEIIPRYQDAADLMQRAYEAGAASYSDWLQVQDELTAARFELIDASAMAHLSLIEIERLTGQSMTPVVAEE